MVDECPHYREKRRVWSRNLDVDADTQAEAEAKQWERFIDITESGIKMKQQCLAPLSPRRASTGASTTTYVHQIDTEGHTTVCRNFSLFVLRDICREPQVCDHVTKYSSVDVLGL